jgi:hypothetical protein
MPEERQPTEGRPAEGAPGEGVFGKLPSERPSVRSPRRRAASQDAQEPNAGPRPEVSASRARPGPKRSRSAPQSPPRPTASRPPPTAPTHSEPPEGEREGGAVEDLAWAGITVAAEAATLGVRLLSRAVEAVRKPPGRP